jgi:hypothetical protein
MEAPNFKPFADRLWSELSNYCLIGYTPEATNKERRSISVKVSRGGGRVTFRRLARQVTHVGAAGG